MLIIAVSIEKGRRKVEKWKLLVWSPEQEAGALQTRKQPPRCTHVHLGCESRERQRQDKILQVEEGPYLFLPVPQVSVEVEATVRSSFSCRT